jgi:hypothetical protein
MQGVGYQHPQLILTRHMPDGRAIDVNALTYGRARLSIGIIGSLAYDDGW